MKKNLLVLVLLMSVAVWSVPSLSSSAAAAEVQDRLEDRGETSDRDLIFDTMGEPDDDSGEGDPGDAGDGYGASKGHRFIIDGSDVEGLDSSGLSGYWLILLSMIQLAL